MDQKTGGPGGGTFLSGIFCCCRPCIYFIRTLTIFGLTVRSRYVAGSLALTGARGFLKQPEKQVINAPIGGPSFVLPCCLSGPPLRTAPSISIDFLAASFREPRRVVSGNRFSETDYPPLTFKLIFPEYLRFPWTKETCGAGRVRGKFRCTAVIGHILLRLVSKMIPPVRHNGKRTDECLKVVTMSQVGNDKSSYGTAR
jgi:hypothetical protein